MTLSRTFLAATSFAIALAVTTPSQAFSLKKLGKGIVKTVKVVERKTVNTVKDAGRIAGKDAKAIGKGVGGGAKAVANVGLKGADKVGNVARKGFISGTEWAYRNPAATAGAAMLTGPVGVVGKAGVVAVGGAMAGQSQKVMYKDNGQNRRFLPARIK